MTESVTATNDILPSQRHLFDIARSVVYCNAAYMTPWPTAFRNIAARAAEERLHPWETGAEGFFAMSEEVRGLAARLFGATSEHIAIHPALSYSVATAARNLPIAKGQTILTLGEEFPSNYYGWARRAEETGARVRILSGTPEGDWTARVLAAIDEEGERIALAALPHVHWASGSRLDLVTISRALKEVGAALFLDLSQSLGALPAPISEIDPDFAGTVGYKWLFGPYALGFCYVAERWWDGVPLEENWIVRAEAQDFRRLVHYREEYAPGARRYDMGERTQFLAMPLARAALKLVHEWSPERTARTLGRLSERLIARLQEAGFQATPAEWRSPHLFAARHPDHGAADLVARWNALGLKVSARGDWIRIAPHLWIDSEDEERFARIIADLPV
ncbi:MAG: aminotransferase class V-fold PLP-dependent enzyme [Alphaproteobacteria bacterium]|nr:MAG: aminotransferase class V-fold PLP-dependent enzyme [Alphaproteobacteria bacterium]